MTTFIFSAVRETDKGLNKIKKNVGTETEADRLYGRRNTLLLKLNMAETFHGGDMSGKNNSQKLVKKKILRQTDRLKSLYETDMGKKYLLLKLKLKENIKTKNERSNFMLGA